MKNTLTLFETDADRFQPDTDFKYSTDPEKERQYVLDQQFLAFLVGTVALGLPFAMLLGAGIGTCFYDSISHFYYSQFFGDVLVSALVFIGTFLVAYRGENPSESRLATFAGLSAFGIAVFPTTGRGCEQLDFSGRVLADLKAPTVSDAVSVSPPQDIGQFFELFRHVDTLHFGSAALLFSFLAFYSFFVFTRIIKNEHLVDGKLTAVKQNTQQVLSPVRLRDCHFHARHGHQCPQHGHHRRAMEMVDGPKCHLLVRGAGAVGVRSVVDGEGAVLRHVPLGSARPAGTRVNLGHCRAALERLPRAYSHSMVPGGFDVMS